MISNKFFLCWAIVVLLNLFPEGLRGETGDGNIDTLPQPTVVEKADVIALSLEKAAAIDFELRKLPSGLTGWRDAADRLRRNIWQAAGVTVDHNLPLDCHQTGSLKAPGYTIKKIYFQTRQGVYATANLYVPDGEGPFPAVVNMHGHWEGGKAGEMVQSCAHVLALNGYVCLNIDAWGSGERTTTHGVHEYHGANLGAALTNIGETLLGAQLADNIRGVDLLCSLDYVDKDRIGATGASGGGNQTMWLSAMDDRIKASMPVVSVGTFQSYIMASNCVCELLPGGLTFSEASGVLSLIAPRALKIASALQEKNKAFFASEMLRSFGGAKNIYTLYGKTNNISYGLFDTPHGYWPAMRRMLLGWFALHLKGQGDGSPVKEPGFRLLPPEELMVFPVGKRDPLVVNTIEYSKKKGAAALERINKMSAIDLDTKITQLKKLSMYSNDDLKYAHLIEKNVSQEKWILETASNQLIPVAVYPARHNEQAATLILFTDKNNEGSRKRIVADYLQQGRTVAIADLRGIGSDYSPQGQKMDGSLPPFHTLARADLWLGQSIEAGWAEEIRILIDFLKEHFSVSSLSVDAWRETAIATLMQADFNNNIDTCILRDCPLSYLVDERNGIDYFNMSIHLPGIIPWGDISMLTALSGCKMVEFRNPVSLSGIPVAADEVVIYEKSIKREMELAGAKGSLRFIDKE